MGLFLVAFVSALMRSRSSDITPRRVLVVPAGKLGDIVCTTPVLHAIRTHLPETTLYVAEHGGAEPLLADSGLVDQYVPTRTLGEYRAALVREGIDTVLLTGPSLFDLAAALTARVPCIVAPRVVGGFSPQETRTYRMLLRFVEEFPYHIESYAPRERLRALEPLGITTDDTGKHLAFSEHARHSCEAYLREYELREGAYAVISPSAGNKIKEWPADRFARVAEYIVRRGVPVVVIGTARDQKEVAAMLQALAPETKVIDACGRFSLDELKAFIATATLFVSVDTGPLYIAEAFGVPTVDIVGPVDERVQPPVGPRHAVVVPERTRPQLSIMNARVYDEAEARRQVESISVEQVTEAIDILLSRRG